MGTSTDEFDWDTEECVVVPPRMGIAVHLNQVGNIVVRVQGERGPGDYDAVVIPWQHAMTVGRRISELGAAADGNACREVIERGSEDPEFVDHGKYLINNEEEHRAFRAQMEADAPRDRTAAERQRRYRERKRNGAGVTRDARDGLLVAAE